MKEHACKAILARLTEGHRNTSSRNPRKGLAPQNLSRCDSVNVRVSRQFRAHLTHFLHSFRCHFAACAWQSLLLVLSAIGIRRFYLLVGARRSAGQFTITPMLS